MRKTQKKNSKMINKIIKKIELHPYVILVIYENSNEKTNDVVIVKNKPQSKNNTELDNRTIETISAVSKRRKQEKRTQIMTFEFETDFLNTVTNWCDYFKITLDQLFYAFIEFVANNDNTDVIRQWMENEKMNNLDIEKLYSVTREEFAEDVDAVLEKVKETSPILIRSKGEPDLLLFDYNHYMKLFGNLYTKEQIEEIEAGCLSCKESYE